MAPKRANFPVCCSSSREMVSSTTARVIPSVSDGRCARCCVSSRPTRSISARRLVRSLSNFCKVRRAIFTFPLPVRPVSPNTHGKSRDDRQEKLPLRRFFPPSTFAMSLWHGRQKARKCSARSIVPEVLPDTARRVSSLASPASSPEVPTRWTDGRTAHAPPEKPATQPCAKVALSSSAVPHTDWFLSSRR